MLDVFKVPLSFQGYGLHQDWVGSLPVNYPNSRSQVLKL